MAGSSVKHERLGRHQCRTSESFNTVHDFQYDTLAQTHDGRLIGVTSRPIRDRELRRRLWNFTRRGLDVIASNHTGLRPKFRIRQLSGTSFSCLK